MRESIETFLIGLSFDRACFQNGQRFCKNCGRQFKMGKRGTTGKGDIVGEEGTLRGCCGLALVCGDCLIKVSGIPFFAFATGLDPGVVTVRTNSDGGDHLHVDRKIQV